MEIKWNKLAVKQLMDAIQFLEDNEQFAYAEKIETEILSKVKALPRTSQIYQTDRLLLVVGVITTPLQLQKILFLNNYLILFLAIFICFVSAIYPD